MSEAGAAAVSTAVRFALAAVGARRLQSAPRTAFYDPPAVVPDRPGELLKAEPGRFYIDPFRLIPAPARVERIMFTTTDRVVTEAASALKRAGDYLT